MATSTPTSTPLIEWSLLGHVVLYSLVIAVGLVVMFSASLAALSLARASERSAAARFSGAVAAALTLSGATRRTGRLPVNPDGGLKAKGHPIGATGVSQAHEVFLQLRRQAGERNGPPCSAQLNARAAPIMSPKRWVSVP